VQTVELQVLSPEEQAAKNAAILAENEAKERDRIAAANLAAGHAKPEPGAHYWVTAARGITRRSRAGVTFGQERLQLVVVESVSDPGDLPAGAIAINVNQANAILNDNGLNVHTRSATEAEAADLRTQLQARTAENAALKAEVERLKREARQQAPADPNGGPSRLAAARKVKAPDPDGFGGKD